MAKMPYKSILKQENKLDKKSKDKKKSKAELSKERMLKRMGKAA